MTIFFFFKYFYILNNNIQSIIQKIRIFEKKNCQPNFQEKKYFRYNFPSKGNSFNLGLPRCNMTILY